jgi:hypothetical protein
VGGGQVRLTDVQAKNVQAAFIGAFGNGRELAHGRETAALYFRRKLHHAFLLVFGLCQK